jgi:hypothetical protein
MRVAPILLLAALTALLCGCNPSERRPGLWLSGEPAAFPADWTFTSDINEIAVQVATPYLIPHSVTIWCASLDGQLYVGARAPETKRWPGWVDRDPNVRLLVDGKLYDATLVPLDDPVTLTRLMPVYAAKYSLPSGAQPPDAPRSRYWHVTPRR